MTQSGWVTWGGFVGLLGVLTGCRAHLEAGARAGAGPAEVHADGEITTARAAPRVRFVAGKLDYSGAINFETGKADLVGQATEATLESLAAYLARHPGMKVRIEGHTDDVGTDAYNLILSRQRAGTVQGWLRNHGVAAERLAFVGYGEARPLVPNDSDAARARNRRVDFVVTQGAPPADEIDPAPARPPEPRGVAPVEAVPERAPEPASAAACPERPIGFHLNAIGPAALVGADLAYQPRCWIELAIGLGFDHGEAEATGADGLSRATAGINVLSVPARARLWPLRRHSPIFDVGFGVARYDARGNATSAEGQLEYQRTGTVPFAFAGAGYGFRSSGAFRLALLIGGIVQGGALDPSDVTATAGYDPADVALLRRDVDRSLDGLLDPRPWFEASFGWLY